MTVANTRSLFVLVCMVESRLAIHVAAAYAAYFAGCIGVVTSRKNMAASILQKKRFVNLAV
jgi:hypothetical protein